MSPKSDLIPKYSGTYVLLLQLAAKKRLRVGKLARLTFDSGWYGYVGSAFGPGGLAARVGRHLKLKKKRRWHIDYLRGTALAEGVWIAADAVRREHAWAALLSMTGRPVAGFGSSDCRCGSHLFHFSRCPDPLDLARRLQASWIALRHDGDAP